MTTTGKVVLWGYGLLCLAAAVIAVIGTQGLFETQPDGLAAVYLILVGLPWSLIVSGLAFAGIPTLIAQLAIFAAPLINIAILARLFRKA